MDPGRAKPTRFTASNSREEMRVTMSSSKLGSWAQLGEPQGWGTGSGALNGRLKPFFNGRKYHGFAWG